MQKSKLDSTRDTIFLALNSTYDTVEIGLFCNDKAIAVVTESKNLASKNMAAIIAHMMQNNHCMWSDLSFIAVNQGPGPFTLLRSVIATVNGLSFASSVPLIGIDGLDALLQEYNKSSYECSVALLNAFNNEVYFGIQQGPSTVLKGYCAIKELCERLASLPAHKIHLCGNGATLYKEPLIQSLSTRATIDTDPQACSLRQIARMGLEQWHKKEGLTDQLLPLYLKQSIAS